MIRLYLPGGVSFRAGGGEKKKEKRNQRGF